MFHNGSILDPRSRSTAGVKIRTCNLISTQFLEKSAYGVQLLYLSKAVYDDIEYKTLLSLLQGSVVMTVSIEKLI